MQSLIKVPLRANNPENASVIFFVEPAAAGTYCMAFLNVARGSDAIRLLFYAAFREQGRLSMG